MSQITQFRFEVLGKVWTLRLMKRKKYAKKNGKDSVAMTYRQKRRIDLSPFGKDLETITHEITHAYLTELCLDSANPDADALEEIFCEMMAKHGAVLISQSLELYNQILLYQSRSS
jgi:hypothetical protein